MYATNPHLFINEAGMNEISLCHRGWSLLLSFLLFLLVFFPQLLFTLWYRTLFTLLCLPIIPLSCLRQMMKASFIVCLVLFVTLNSYTVYNELSTSLFLVVSVLNWHHSRCLFVTFSAYMFHVLPRISNAQHIQIPQTVNISRLIRWHLISVNR